MWPPIRKSAAVFYVLLAIALPAAAQTSAASPRVQDRLAHLFDPAPLQQSITIPNTFVNGTVADATQVNANFTALSSGALNRNGGTMLGTLNSRALTPTADATYDVGTSVLRYKNLWTSGTTAFNGLTYTWPASQTANYFLQTNGSGTLSWTAVTSATVASTTSTGTQDDFAAGVTFAAGQVSTLRANNATLLTLRGIAAGVDGAILRIVSIGAGQVDLAHQNAGSAAANRFINFATSANTSLAAGVGVATLIYDGTTARWRLVEHDQGAYITPTFAAGNFTATGGTGGTWTVGSAVTSAYYLKGRQLHVEIFLTATTTSAAPSKLRVGNGQWGGFTASDNVSSSSSCNTDTSAFAWEACFWSVGATIDLTTAVTFQRENFGGANWTASTAHLELRASAVFQVQ